MSIKPRKKAAEPKKRKRVVEKRKRVVEKRNPLTQAQIIIELAARTELDPSEVRTIFTELAALWDEEMFGRGGSREFQIPQLGVKLFMKAKPALPERDGRNPATGKTIRLKPRPASWDLKMRKLKPVKEGISLMEPPTNDD